MCFISWVENSINLKKFQMLCASRIPSKLGTKLRDENAKKSILYDQRVLEKKQLLSGENY